MANHRDCTHCGRLIDKTVRLGKCGDITIVAKCDLHDECTPYARTNCRAVQSCERCPDYEPA